MSGHVTYLVSKRGKLFGSYWWLALAPDPEDREEPEDPEDPEDPLALKFLLAFAVAL